MKEYKLSSWPDLSAPYHRTCHRRMVSDMSHRYVSVSQLMAASSLSRQDVRMFLEMLADRGLLREREAEGDSILDSIWPIGQWFKRAKAQGKSGDAAKH